MNKNYVLKWVDSCGSIWPVVGASVQRVALGPSNGLNSPGGSAELGDPTAEPHSAAQPSPSLQHHFLTVGRHPKIGQGASLIGCGFVGRLPGHLLGVITHI